ncbi:MAG: redox-regulated ATPase YchF [Nitrospiraceae bacterium]|nr:redox-regulated ATPase YchF [Nitrospiraceae bacterium]
MKLGIVGLPGSGKTTIFNALTGSTAEVSAYQGGKKDPNLAVIKVPDGRLERLSSIYCPKKTTPAQVQYVDIGGTVSAKETDPSMDEFMRFIRPVDALVHVVRNFERAGEPPKTAEDLDALESEFILADLIAIEKRIERLKKEIARARKGDPKELEALEECHRILEGGEALRAYPELAQSPLLRGYAFLSAKPCILVLNSGDEVELGTTELRPPKGVVSVEIKGRLEMELAQLSPEEAQLFREDLGLEEPATFRLIRESYRLLGLISFFTVGKDEVRAWTIRLNTPAQQAAGAVHSDMERGFIRAEVASYEDLMACGNYPAAQKAGKVRLEGKEYLVQDGDIINFRFNV